MIKAETHLLKSRVNTSLGTLLLISVALWAWVTIWQAAMGTNPIANAFIAAYEKSSTVR